jgi:16S rRNA pseudouridine516 synthase
MKRVPPSVLRLDRLLTQVSGLSRTQAQRVIRRGEVFVDGAPVTDPGQHVHVDARLERAGEVMGKPALRYLMLNKPPGVVCAVQDREHRTVLDLLSVSNKAGLHVAGRLDIDTTGLVLITDDGEWSHRITAPRHKQPKVYRVTLDSPLDEKAVTVLESGVRLRNEPKRCAPALVERLAGNEVRLTIAEGKYHQVKRMFAAVGNRVRALHRECIGAITLDPELPEGGFRPLTPEEMQALQKLGQ